MFTLRTRRLLVVGLALGWAGCGEMPTGTESAESAAVVSLNGLPNINGLTSTNGLASTNGLTITHGLQSRNGLQSTNGLMTTDAGRKTVAYLVMCALPAGHFITKRDQFGRSYTFWGLIGMTPEYEWQGCGQSCELYLSGCLMAH